jgi:hypothetical protein
MSELRFALILPSTKGILKTKHVLFSVQGAGAPFLFVYFLWASKENRPAPGERKSHLKIILNKMITSGT